MVRGGPKIIHIVVVIDAEDSSGPHVATVDSLLGAGQRVLACVCVLLRWNGIEVGRKCYHIPEAESKQTDDQGKKLMI